MRPSHFAILVFAVLLSGCTPAASDPAEAPASASAEGPAATNVAEQGDNADEAKQNEAKQDEPAEKPEFAAEMLVEAMRAVSLAREGKVDEARAMVDELRRTAAELIEQASDEFGAFEVNLVALQASVDVESALADGDPEPAQQALLEYVEQQVRENDDPRIRAALEMAFMRATSSLARTDPDAADALLDRLEAALASLADNDGSESGAAVPPHPLRQRLRETIATTRQQMALLGTPAAWPDQADRWVNVEAGLTRDDLRGKVVLLDFFAVWCGPCIATFPHLREWQEEFGNRGFQVVGVTKYYQYGWDEQAGRPVRSADLEPDAEQAALEKFAAHHELTHPIAMVPDESLGNHYVVTGIPHAVLIDRQGNVRLFRIGSGPKNAADLRQAIEECLNEQPPAELAQPEAAAAPAA